jgi:hypothetical protein
MIELNLGDGTTVEVDWPLFLRFRDGHHIGVCEWPGPGVGPHWVHAAMAQLGIDPEDEATYPGPAAGVDLSDADIRRLEEERIRVDLGEWVP